MRDTVPCQVGLFFLRINFKFFATGNGNPELTLTAAGYSKTQSQPGSLFSYSAHL